MKMFKILFFLFGVAMSLSANNSWFDHTPLEIRQRINAMVMNLDVPLISVGSVIEKEIEFEGRNTSIRIYFPESSSATSLIVMIHGGAFVAGNLETHDNLARFLCKNGSAIVVSVGYALAPERKFPYQLEQCYDVLRWATAQYSLPTFVIGDSAGGNMAAALCLMARDRNGPKIDLQALINPAPDLSCNGTLKPQGDELDILRYQAIHYIENEEDVYHPYASPLLAEDLTHLPPALILVAETDALRSDGQAYAERLKIDGVETRLYCQNNSGHLGRYGAKASKEASESLDVLIRFLKEHNLSN